MSNATFAIYGAILLGGMSIGAFLVMHDHPWFGFLAMLSVAVLEVKSK